MGQRTIAATSGVMFFTGIVFSALISFLSVFVGIVLLHSGPNTANDVRDIIYFLAIPLVTRRGALGPAPDPGPVPERDRPGARRGVRGGSLPDAADAFHPALGALPEGSCPSADSLSPLSLWGSASGSPSAGRPSRSRTRLPRTRWAPPSGSPASFRASAQPSGSRS